MNPKSEGFESPATLGNYLRLPYPGALATGFAGHPDAHREVLRNAHVGGYTTTCLEHFLTLAEQSLATRDALEAAAALWVPPAPLHHDPTMGFSGEVVLDEALTKRLGGLAYTILTQGPLDGGERSGALFKLAHACHKDGLSADEALAVVTAGDLAWGKYHARHDGERYLRQTVERAYT